MQPGVGYNLSAGQAGLTLAIDEPLQAGDPEQFRVSVMYTGSGHGVQVRKGFVRFTSSRNGDAWAWGCWQAEVQKTYCFPDGSRTIGPFATAADSPLVDLGGYVQIQPASVEGGSDSWGVYIIGCGSDMDGFWPYLAVIADGSDADIKSDFFNGSDPQIIIRQVHTTELVEVETPTGSTYLTIQNDGTLVQYNYNCQKWKIASLTFDGSAFIVEQKHLGALSLANPVQFQGLDVANIPPYTPNYEPQLNDWLGAWSGYTKDSSGATVQV